ncbi:Protein lingerer like [Actinidia chinensis var. chinensis]|uniref:Protein lingerer like n=1 Tax=Actinidia chinensis var. chinensis TaxID=1590841 RepID=A0A2R6RAE3_ACTCC|nr:Protein lingerer like [Actinidia chinensis var. chinensis]
MSLVMTHRYCLNSPHTSPHFNHHRFRRRLHPIPVSSSLRRNRRRHKNPNPPKPSDQNVRFIIDTKHLSNKAKSLLSLSQLRFNKFVQSGNEAFEDLRTLVSVDSDRRLVFSCRQSTLRFAGNLVLWSCVVVFALRFFAKLGLGFWDGLGFRNNSGLVMRRDRSLGGREVVVASRRNNADSKYRVLKNALSEDWESKDRLAAEVPKIGVRKREERKLPSWWPILLPDPPVTVDKEKYQSVANRLIRAIMDYRISGMDMSEEDVVQFRRLCRTSGARVSINTANSRDWFYRASVNFVLNICCSAENQTTSVHIDGEDARHFIAGLADNIGLENTRAARMVSAAVAARTRSCFLQAGALEMQGKHSEAVVELSKICLIHRIFPPEECSPEMEMVARGLEKHLKVEQREFLMDMLLAICGDGNCRSIAEALGLVPLT